MHDTLHKQRNRLWLGHLGNSDVRNSQRARMISASGNGCFIRISSIYFFHITASFAYTLVSMHRRSTNAMDSKGLASESLMEVRQEPPNTDEKPNDAQSFPDGGLQAWLVVLGAFFGLFISFGWTNCMFYAVSATNRMADRSQRCRRVPRIL